MIIKIVNKNISCLGIAIQYNVNGEPVVVKFDNNGVAEVQEAQLEFLIPYGIEKYEIGMEVFDITNATNEELKEFLKGRTWEYLAELAEEAGLPNHEWESKGKMSLAMYVFDKLAKPDEEILETLENQEAKRGRPKKEKE